MIDEKLLNVLACPRCKGDVRLKGDRLICNVCKLAYPIRDDIPIMLIEETMKIPPCPRCKGDVRLEGDRLICDVCKLAYSIIDNAPIMKTEEAEFVF